MPAQIIWTALPNGLGSGGGRRTLNLSVLLSPRLTNGETLALFPDFIDWPSTLEGLTFVAHIDGQSFTEGQELTRARVSNSELWCALFKPNTFVRSHAFDDYKDRNIHSYPVMNVLGFIKNQYTKIAIDSPLNFPPVALLRAPDSFGGAAIPAREKEGRRKELHSLVSHTALHALPPSPPKQPNDFNQVDLFHATNDTATVRPRVALPEIDFHQMVSLLGEYPELLRLLGLAIDFTIDLPPGATPIGELSVEPVFPSATSVTAVTPRTALDPNGQFIAAPRDRLSFDARGRFLKLRSDQFGVVPLDVDGAAIKAINFANQLLQAAEFKTEDTPAVASVPSLRSGGLSIVRTGRAVKLGNTFKNAAGLNANIATNEMRLFAEDVVRGHRVDVRELTNGEPQPWLSLCRRDAVHNFTDTGRTASFNDVEGIASMGIMQKKLHLLADDFVLHESMFRWAGASLCVPPPLDSVPPDQTDLQVSGRKPPFGLKSSFTTTADSLPVLRFGRVYQFRVRTVDLAGNGPSPNSSGPGGTP